MNEMIKRRKRLTEPEAAYFMSQLVLAVRYMHDKNVIHRDLKLGNLFLDKNIEIKVGDLGLATRVEDKDEKRKTICGTPNYIAPEVIQGDKSKRGHSFEVDIWSMGVILYTVLIGKPPYEAKDVKSTYQRIINNEYTFPSHVEISDTARDLIESMLQSIPADRYVSFFKFSSRSLFSAFPILTCFRLFSCVRAVRRSTKSKRTHSSRTTLSQLRFLRTQFTFRRFGALTNSVQSKASMYRATIPAGAARFGSHR